ncbi:hypothetical protein T484DRAFT_1804539, partial [Baffinella frigidus]
MNLMRERVTVRRGGQLLERAMNERVTVRRGEQLLEWAMNVMKVHAGRKAILELLEWAINVMKVHAGRKAILEILEWAMDVMKVHAGRKAILEAGRKAILEVSFADEEGHGSGVTSEFYSLVSDELQRRDLGLWLCEDPRVTAPIKK